MSQVFELVGEVASEVFATEDGGLLLWLECGAGLAPILVPRGLGGEVCALRPGDRVGLEVERSGGSLIARGVRSSYLRDCRGCR